MRFLIDANLPPALAEGLVARGHDATHLADHGLLDASDTVIWAFALHGDWIIVSKDEDFARRRASSVAGPAVIWIRLPNTRRRALLIWFEAVLPRILDALDSGESLVEVF